MQDRRMISNRRGGSRMYREELNQREVYVSHDLSRKASMKKHEKRGSFDGDQYISSKIEMRFCNERGVI
jgi:hypothetical protein